MKRRRDTASAQPGAGLPIAELLPATLAHELNNIVASLRGFLELARDAADTPGIGQSAFDEISLGVERVAELAADVAAFAGRSAAVQVVPLRDCVGVTDASSRAPSIRWDLDPTALVRADSDAARRAVATLCRLAAGGVSASAVSCHREPPTTPLASCAVCAAECSAASAWFSQPLPPGRADRGANPDAVTSNCLTLQEFRFEALSRAAHDAGGHLIVRNTPDTVSLVLPLA